MEVDLDDPSNQNLKQNLDEKEDIEVVVVEDIDQGNIYEKMVKVIAGSEIAMSGMLMTLINGMQVANYLSHGNKE